MGPQDWTMVLPIVVVSLNAAPLQRLRREPEGTLSCLLRLLGGLAPKKCIDYALPSITTTISATLAVSCAAQLLDIGELQKAIDGIHQDVSERTDKAREDQVWYHNKVRNISECNFAVGDIVLVRRAVNRKRKLRFA